MTVENTNNTISYTGNGSVDTFAYNFLTYSEDHLKIYLDDSLQTSGYTITGIGSEDGGNVIFDTPPLDDVIVFIERVLPLSQLIEYQEYGPFPAKTNERGLDYGVMIDQQLNTRINDLTENALLKNVLTKQTVIGPVEFQGKTEVVSPPTSPNDVLRLQDVDISSDTVKASFIKYNIPITAGQTVLTTPIDFQSAIVLIDGVTQFETSGAYIQDGVNSTITLAEPLEGNEIVEVWINNLFVLPASLNNTFTGLIDTPSSFETFSGYSLRVNPQESGLDFYKVQGTQAEPYEFDTCYDFVNNLPYDYLRKGDFVRVNGRTILDDGMGATYQITDIPPSFRRNYENYIPVNGDGADTGVTLWAVLKDGFKRDFKAQPIEIIAHRGFNDLGVQNTIANYSAAAKYPCDAFETDWQITSDGFGVLYHDLTLDEDTNGTGAIKNNTFDYVRNLTFSELGSGFWSDKIRISKVEDFFDVATRLNKRVYIEVKDYRQIEDIQVLIDVIVAYDWEHMTNISSFRIDDVVEVRNRNKKIAVGWLTTNINSTQENIDFDKLQKLKLADALIVDTIMVQFPAVQQKAYDAGVGVAAWGIQYELDVENLMAVNVPRFIVDNPKHPLLTRGQQNVTY